MIESVKTGVHSCVISSELKSVRSPHGGKHGRVFPQLPACVADETAASSLADLLRFARA